MEDTKLCGYPCSNTSSLPAHPIKLSSLLVSLGGHTAVLPQSFCPSAPLYPMGLTRPQSDAPDRAACWFL